MNPDHLRIVQARAAYANGTLTMVAIGIHIFMVLYGFSVFLETPKHSRKGRKRYIATSLVITALSAFSASLDMARYFQVLFGSTSPSHWHKLHVATLSRWEGLLTGTILGVLVWIGDALLVYRCYVICVDYSWVAAVPGAFSFCALVVNLQSWYRHNSDHRAKYEIAFVLLTISTNTIVTSLIAAHLFRTRRTLLKLLPSQEIRLYTGVVAILIESALPLSFFGIIAAAFMLAKEAPAVRSSEGILVCYYTFVGLFYIFCTLSPQMIIFRITTGHSFVKFPSLTRDVPLSPIDTTRQSASLDMASYFQVLFNATSPQNWRVLLVNSFGDWKSLASNTVLGIVVWIGDLFLVYRCYVISTDYRWVAAFPGATSLSGLVVFFLLWYGYDPDRAVKYESAYTFLTVLTNLFVTCIIAFRVLRARRTLSKLVSTKDLQLYTGVVAILIESALPPSIFGLIAAGLLLARIDPTVQLTEGLMVSYNTFIGLFYVFCTLSPHMIVFRIITGYSFVKFLTHTGDVSLTTDRWASQTGESSSFPEIDVERLQGHSSRPTKRG
ncbi:hypothetical protein MD484_g2437, partial [Candolleomyces efflorescens]